MGIKEKYESILSILNITTTFNDKRNKKSVPYTIDERTGIVTYTTDFDEEIVVYPSGEFTFKSDKFTIETSNSDLNASYCVSIYDESKCRINAVITSSRNELSNTSPNIIIITIKGFNDDVKSMKPAIYLQISKFADRVEINSSYLNPLTEIINIKDVSVERLMEIIIEFINMSNASSYANNSIAHSVFKYLIPSLTAGINEVLQGLKIRASK